jgi:hypothetical protein
MTEREDVAETIAVETVAVTTPAGVEAADGGAEELGKVRELVLKAHPDVVPDLVRGDSVDELIASVEPARSAYQRIAEQVRGAESGVGSRESEQLTSDLRPPTSDSAVAQPPAVPAGGAATIVDPGDLAPTSKIAQALAARKKRG